MDVRTAFRSVDANSVEYRGSPFWAWNDDLNPKEIRRQIREMRRAGLGGHFMHARIGLVTPYMSEQWRRCIKAAVEESKALGMAAWLYDEDCWPSGSGGGAVPAGGSEYQQKTIAMETLSPKGFSPKSNTIAAFLGVQRRGNFRELRRVAPAEAAEAASARETLLHFHYTVCDGYADLLSASAVDRFIQSTHEKYRGWLGREFGKTIPGIFTDEPQYQLFPWLLDLPGHFKKTKREDLLDLLPSLFLRYGDYRKVRWQYFSAVNELFVHAYTRQLGKWCAKHRLALTGHVMAEDSLLGQVLTVGAAMPHYEHMQVPGVDQILRGMGQTLTCKQASSAAHQLDRPRVISEMFGAAGWNVSFEELKGLAEWQFALGVNQQCQHLSLYTLRGCRKRDCPPSLHVQQPWWDDYRLLNDLFARQQCVLSSGTHVCDILVLHPIESVYAVFDNQRRRDVQELDSAFVQLSHYLLSIQRDFDYGDESLLAGRARVSGGRLHVGSASYAAVLLPPMVTIRSSTLRMLARFIKAGGCVVRTGRLPLRVDGEPSKAAIKALGDVKKTRLTTEALAKALGDCLPPRVMLRPDRGNRTGSVYVHHRDCGDLQVLFLANTSNKDAANCELRVRGSGAFEQWDVETGDIAPLPTRSSGGYATCPVKLAPTGSAIVALDSMQKPSAAVAAEPRELRAIDLEPRWLVRRLDPNALTLDCCHWRADGGAWNGPVPVLDLQDHLAQVDRTMNLEMKFAVNSRLAKRPGRRLWLALETPADYSAAINGRNLRLADSSPWIDKSIRLVRIDGWKLEGDNEILLRRRFAGNPQLYQRMHDPSIHAGERERMRFPDEIESIYVVGDFAVRSGGGFTVGPRGTIRTPGPFGLSEESVTADGSRLTEDGLLFYAGRVELQQSVNVPIELLRRASSAQLELEPPNAIVTAVSVNGEPAGKRAWRPYRFDVGDLLKEGRNEIAVTLTGSLRNLLGPHHHVDGEPNGVCPTSFRRTKSWIDPPATPKDIWRDDYSFVRFGLAGAAKLVFRA